ncbi:formylglycine-generating enzyme family protein [bacterium]|nr:formylglycine-generating enzyme family protein [bacterium]
MFKLAIMLTSVFILSACAVNFKEPKKANIIDDINMVVIPTGTFEMGVSNFRQKFDFLKLYVKDHCLRCDNYDKRKTWCPEEHCQHTVYVNAFKIDKYEVTNKEYDECVKAKKCTPAHRDDKKCGIFNKSYLSCTSSPDDDDVCSPSSKGVSVFNDEETGESIVGAILPDTFRGENQPVVCVDWYQAKQYCEWRGKRLPTEAEWEKAAKGGKNTLYPWGDDIKDLCKYANVKSITLPDGSHTCELPNKNKTTSVGSFNPNDCGLYDMIGNVAEWVSDWYKSDYYSVSSSENPQGPDEPEKEFLGPRKVIRGGSWTYFQPERLHSFSRDSGYIGRVWDQQGIRCVKSIEVE